MPKCLLDGLLGAGRLLTPIERPLEIAGTLATLPLLASGEAPILALNLAKTTTFYRGVGAAEAADFARRGALRAGAAASGNEGKYVTNSIAAAARWGAQGGQGGQVLRITAAADATKAFTYLGRIDGVGQAWWAPMSALEGAKVSVVADILRPVIR
jgi:hypothetical protein